MREHMGLFRGKRIDNGEWVWGNLLSCDERYFMLPANNIETWNTDWLTKGQYIFGRFVEVDPDAIGECTGLRDKNGKLIFEHQKFKYEGELYEVRIVCGEWRLYDKFDHYCELYKYAGSGEIVSED